MAIRPVGFSPSVVANNSGLPSSMEFQIPPGKSASLTLYPKAIRGVMGGTNDTTRLTLGARDPRSLGKLKVELVVDSGMLVQGPLLLQLLTG